MSDGIDLRFRRSNQTFGTSLSFENDILSLLNNRGDILSSVNIDLIKKEELPTANEDNLGVIYLYTGPDDEYKHGYFYECVENSGVYSWENIVVQDSYLKSETYNKSETDTELAKKLNTDGSNTFTGVLKMRASISFKGAVAPSWSGIGIYELKDDDSVSLMASMEKTDGFTPASNNTYNIGVNSRKWKDLYLAGKAYVPTINNGGDITVPASAGTMALTSDLTNFADKDLSNLTSQGKNIANWSSNVSNCITEIPQDIKLELNNGTLTLKAGSKVYVPNGTGVFDEITIASDLTATASGNDTRFVFYYNGALGTLPLSQSYSGSSAPTGIQYMLWYDTANNLVKFTTDSGSTWTTNNSLTLGIITTNASQITSIDQVFNGFGYIGSTVFALPGVKGLIPNGRNEDGTLKSAEFTTSSVLTNTNVFTNINDFHFYINSNEIISAGNHIYNYDEAMNINTISGTNAEKCLLGTAQSDSSAKFYNARFSTAFHALDYNDTSYIASQSFPSKNIGLTLGASDTPYTAPTAGYIWFAKVATVAGQYIQIITPRMYNQVYSSAVNQALTIWVPIKKGETFRVRYNANGTTEHFEFIKAEGEV